MFYVYILHSEKDQGLYIGFTSDLKRRVDEHKGGKSVSTRNRMPMKLVHFEAFLLRRDAKAREEYLKSGYGRRQLASSLKELFKLLNSS